MGFMDFVDAMNNFVWGPPLIIVLLGTGVIMTIGSGFFQFTHFGWIMRSTFGSLTRSGQAGRGTPGKGTLSAFEAVAIAVGGSVGAGNIAGVATAVASGGPGAIFWMWVCALVGMITKCSEVTLALHYRVPDVGGDRYVGGPTYYMQYGLGEERRWGGGYKILAIIFGLGIYSTYIFTMQNYSIAEAINSTFPKLSMPLVSTFYAVCLTLVIAGGLKRVGDFAVRAVPFMCILYLLFAAIIIVKNVANLPVAFGLIFKGAFTGHAATGGFAGATLSVTIQKGLQRALYSNEAGWGTSPMVHATAITNHPVEQGMWGAFEVFVDTIVVCTATALAIVSAGMWNSGLTSATLTLTTFENEIGFSGRVVIAISMFLFAFTTGTGWYTYYDTLARHAFQKDTPARRVILQTVKYCSAVPGWILVLLSVKYDVTSGSVWGVVDLTTGIPTFVNLLVLLILAKRFFDLIKDYKARYMGIGEVDPEFLVWYEDRKKLSAK